MFNCDREVFATTENGTTDLNSLSTSFLPISELSRNDSDITIIFLSGNGVFSSQPTYDPWYRATVPFANLSSDGLNGTAQIYRQDEAASPLGCASQWQFCDADQTACGPMASYQDALLGALSTFKAEAADRLTWMFRSSNISPEMLLGIVRETKDHSLLSTQTLFHGSQGATLPDNQWQLEVTNWFAICQALTQQSLVKTISGQVPKSSQPVLNLDKPDTAAAKKLCQSQKIRTTKYSSFSFFGILFTYILGIVIIATSFVLEPLIKLLDNRGKNERYSSIEWTSNSTLQLQRLAHDMDGRDDWERCMDSVPTTSPGLLLCGLDLADPEHPRLLRNCSEKPTLVRPETHASDSDLMATVGKKRESKTLTTEQPCNTLDSHDNDHQEDRLPSPATLPGPDASSVATSDIEAVSPITPPTRPM